MTHLLEEERTDVRSWDHRQTKLPEKKRKLEGLLGVNGSGIRGELISIIFLPTWLPAAESWYLVVDVDGVWVLSYS